MHDLQHNPDVLSCLANLSSDEVFTPPEVANAMLDMLPQELWQDSKATFLDPACKSGVFLREIAKRLIEGLKDEIPDLQTRLDHIFQKQLYGIAITDLTALLSRRSLYGSKWANSKYSFSRFDTAEGLIRLNPKLHHTWKNGRCEFCGASQSEYDRSSTLESHAYEFIHTHSPEAIFNMKFDVIIGNPPYQLSDGGGNGKSAVPLYHKFVDQAKKLNPKFLSFIIPSRWMGGGKGLDQFRKNMLSDKRIKNIVDFIDSSSCFSGVDISGGICYFLWKRDYNGTCKFTSVIGNSTSTSFRYLDEFDIVIRHEKALKIIHKVKQNENHFMDEIVLPRRPFGLGSNLSLLKSGDVRVKSTSGYGYISKASVLVGKELLPKYKVIVSKVSAEHAGQPDKNGQMKVLAVIEILPPQTACSESYLVTGVFDSLSNAENMTSYLKTRFFRFLLQQSLFSQNISKDRFAFVPIQDFSKPWTDAELYAKYGLDEEEIAFIESMIKPMDLEA